MNTTTQGNVLIPMEFFKKVRRDYRNWRQATIRELLQNSVDAGATHFQMNLCNTVDGRLQLSALDNGHGMNRDVLENVFLVLGGSKKEANSLGGFGMAKMVLFSADQYEIETSKCLVTGRGAEYSLNENVARANLKGVCVTLTYAAEDINCWRREIETYVGQCNLNAFRTISVTLNGQELKQAVTEYSFGDDKSVAYQPLVGCDYSTVTWCVRGLAMFTETYWSEGNTNFNGRWELGTIDPLQTFTTNRDAFREDVNKEMKARISALIQTHKTKTQGEKFHNVLNYAQPWNPCVDKKEINEHNHPLFPDSFHIRVDGYAERRTAKQQAQMSQAEMAKFLKSRGAGKLAHQWANACKIVLSCDYAIARGVTLYASPDVPTDFDRHDESTVTQMEHYIFGQRIEFGFGFVPGAEALCVSGLSQLFLNPWCVPDDLCLMDVLDLAIHEVAHLWEQNHGQAFTSVEAELRRSIRRWINEREIEKRIAGK